MVEVFKTNVESEDQAEVIVDAISNAFVGYSANFDLEDCDKILRVKCETGIIQSDLLISLLKDFGCEAEVLSDDPILISQSIRTISYSHLKV